jgi:dihydroorotase
VAFEIPAVSNYHEHVRQDEVMKIVLPYTTRYCGRFLPMPNTRPAVSDGPSCSLYEEQIFKEMVSRPGADPDKLPHLVMSVKLLRTTIPEVLLQAFHMGCEVVKIYPDDPDKPGSMTTNTEDGITRGMIESILNGPKTEEDKRFHENLRMIARSGKILSIHGELPKEEVHLREKKFLLYLKALMGVNRKLRVVMEHITTKEAVKEIFNLHMKYRGRVAATITPHHLKNTLTDFIGGKLRPHLHCMPMLKFERDRKALLEAAFSGNYCYFYGADSAPWLKGQKECDCGCAGVWNAPCAIETLFEIFEGSNQLGKLTGFTSRIGDRFYGKPDSDLDLKMVKDSWKMPDEIQGIVPYRAGEIIPWRMEGYSPV